MVAFCYDVNYRHSDLEFPCIFKEVNGKFPDNLLQNTWRLFHVLAQFSFITSETTRLLPPESESISRFIEQLMTWKLRNLENLKKILETLGSDSDYPEGHLKDRF